MIITTDDFNTLNDIMKYTNAGKTEIFTMQQFMRKYIDKNIMICQTCPAQIRFAYKRILSWYDKYKDTFILEDVNNTSEHTCIICETIITDKRKKYCSKKCKDKK